MILHKLSLASVLSLLIAAGCSSLESSTRPSATMTAASTLPAAEAGSPQWWRMMTQPLHGQGEMNGTVYTVIIPRNDIWLQSEMGEIPIAAGISCKFYFYRCDCGLMKVIGEFVVVDYEANDVMDALRTGQFTIASMSPILMNEHPHILSVRFQGEGHTDELIKTLCSALEWVGPARTSTRPAF